MNYQQVTEKLTQLGMNSLSLFNRQKKVVNQYREPLQSIYFKGKNLL